MKPAPILGAFLLFIGMARADVIVAPYLDGNTLMGACKDVVPFCQGYVAGVADADRATAASLKTCFYSLPANANIRQITDIAIKYLQDHPERRHMAGNILVFESLLQAFPCPK